MNKIFDFLKQDDIKYFPVEISKDLESLKILEDPSEDLISLEKKYKSSDWVEIFNTREDLSLSKCKINTWVKRKDYMTLMY